MIRFATESDAEALGRLGSLLTLHHHSLDDHRFFDATERTPAFCADFFEEQVGLRDVLVLVAAIR